jgi:hypothetical protein
MFDKDYTTTWVEGKKGDGIGEAIYKVIPEDCKTINIFNGYGKNQSLYEQNNRPKNIQLTCLVGINPDGAVTETHVIYKTQQFPETYMIELTDTFGVQNYSFPFNHEQLMGFKKSVIEKYKSEFDIKMGSVQIILKLTIRDVYKGSKWDDTCISEMYFNELYISDKKAIYTDVKNVYTGENESNIFIDTGEKNHIKVWEDKNSVFQIIETAANNRWVILIKVPSEVGPGHVETEYLLFNSQTCEIENNSIEKITGSSIWGPFFFNYEEESIFLEYYLSGESDTKTIELK